MKLRGKFAVVPFENPNESTSWRVTGTRQDGKRIRENYPSEAEALARKQELEIETLNFVPDKRISVTRLTPRQEIQAEEAFRKLGDKPLSLAVDFFLANYFEPEKPITVRQASELFLEAKQKEGCRKDTIRNLKHRVGLLVHAYSDKLVSEIMPGHVITLLNRPGIDRVTRDNDRRAMSSFFSWCSSQEPPHCANNPAKKKGRSKELGDDSEPEILELGKVRALLQAAEGYKEGKLIPYITLGLFAAIRPAELARLKWDVINLKTGTITVGPKVAKVRSRRVIQMVALSEKKKDPHGNAIESKLPPTLIEWLEPHLLKRTPIKGRNWRKDFDAVKKIAKVDWTQDVLRHTGISHHFALCQHEGQTAAWAGNSPNMIHRFYKGLVQPGEPEDFFAIRPGNAQSNVIEMPATVAARSR